MTRYARKPSLRESLGTLLIREPSQLIQNRANRHLKGRYRFRAAVRLVLEYIEWICDASATERTEDEVNVTVQVAERKKTERTALSLEDRSILLTDPSTRSTSDITQVMEILRKLRAFRKYSEHLRQSLAGVCLYRYFPAGRTIVRQGHPANNLYFLANGKLALTRIFVDRLTGEETVTDMGVLQPGDIFGEIAMLHVIPRTATVVSKSSVDLLLIDCDAFDEILRDTLTDDWDILRDALVHFNYFKTWSESTVRECCIISRLKDYETNEVVLGDGRGMVNYVHFLLEGECRLIEHINIRERRSTGGHIQYELDDTTTPLSDQLTTRTRKPRGNSVLGERVNDAGNNGNNADRDGKRNPKGELYADYSHSGLLSSIPADGAGSSADRERPAHDRISIVTTTLFDVVNEWHEITDVAAMLMREPSIVSGYDYQSDDDRTIFMQVCRFFRGSCFGLGERMRDRRIVTTTPVRCLLIPRYWLFERNRANIWERVRIWMDSMYPSKRESFERFVKNRKWIEYREGLTSKITESGHASVHTATIYDVPCSIRITGISHHRTMDSV